MPETEGKGERMKTIVVNDMSFAGDMMYGGDMGYSNEIGEMTGSTQQTAKVDELMSSRVFVGGITVGVFVLGLLLGLLSAKGKIKKGMDLYED